MSLCVAVVVAVRAAARVCCFALTSLARCGTARLRHHRALLTFRNAHATRQPKNWCVRSSLDFSVSFRYIGHVRGLNLFCGVMRILCTYSHMVNALINALRCVKSKLRKVSST